MKKICKDIRSYFMALLGLSVIWFLYQLINFPVLPWKYVLVAFGVLAALSLLFIYSQYKSKNKKVNIIGKVGIVVLSLLLMFISYTYLKTVDLFSEVVQSEDTDIVSVIVKKESPYQYIEDLAGKTYASLDSRDSYVDKTLETIEEKQQNMNLKFYVSVDKLANALFDEKVDCIVMNESYRSLIEDTYESFTEDTRVIYSQEYTTKLEETRELDITKDTFSVYISGIDTYGTISTKSRSDVNMIVTVNPQTKKILLTSIPRDYYIPFRALDGKRDKLTHSGLFGVNETKKNVGDYFGIDIDYYVRVNFTSVIDIVDALGGIEVDNPRAFNQFEKGRIHLNGEQALAFSRDRYSFLAGDRERGRNQMRVITGIINKVISPSIIKNYMSLLDSLHSSFQTNLTDEQIISLIRMQINDMSKWDIETISVDGTGAHLYSPNYGSNLYMMVPNDETVSQARTRIKELYK